ncbi:hypothetical protein AmDm5_3111 [Acetobacter malorum]|nr:hypothetical protein AmDm5_3111 [Acetobacter malorum]
MSLVTKLFISVEDFTIHLLLIDNLRKSFCPLPQSESVPCSIRTTLCRINL